MSKTPAIQGGAAVLAHPPVLPAARAEWSVDTEAKNSTAALLGGLATIFRSDKDGLFRVTFEMTLKVEGSEEGAPLKLSFPLKEAPNLVAAQQIAEVLIRESLGKTHPEVLQAAMSSEAAQVIASAPADPF